MIHIPQKLRCKACGRRYKQEHGLCRSCHRAAYGPTDTREIEAERVARADAKLDALRKPAPQPCAREYTLQDPITGTWTTFEVVNL